MVRLNQMDGIGELLEQYAAGSLYMANLIAAQGQPSLDANERENADVSLR